MDTPNKEDWEIRSNRVHSNFFGASVSTNLCCWVCLLVAKQMVLTIGDMSHLFFFQDDHPETVFVNPPATNCRVGIFCSQETFASKLGCSNSE